eukprot:364796-Chlamydomonas_euryale.AAC.4
MLAACCDVHAGSSWGSRLHAAAAPAVETSLTTQPQGGLCMFMSTWVVLISRREARNMRASDSSQDLAPLPGWSWEWLQGGNWISTDDWRLAASASGLLLAQDTRGKGFLRQPTHESRERLKCQLEPSTYPCPGRLPSHSQVGNSEPGLLHAREH